MANLVSTPVLHNILKYFDEETISSFAESNDFCRNIVETSEGHRRKEPELRFGYCLALKAVSATAKLKMHRRKFTFNTFQNLFIAELL